MLLVDVSIFVGDANTADSVERIILRLDGGSAFSNAEGDKELAEGKQELGHLEERIFGRRRFEDCVRGRL